MTTRQLTVLPAMLAVALVLSSGVPCTGSVYSNLMSEFTKYDHRLPGSTNYEQCIEALVSALKSADLDPQIQPFDTVVPHTEWCRLAVNGKPVAPVYPLNNGVAPLVTNGKISGPIHWLGNGNLASMKGKQVRGCIALLDFDSPTVSIEHVFSQGAKAVVFVGSGNANQWNVARICQEGPVVVPRLYITRRTAEQHGLLNGNGQIASIDAKVVLKDAVAKNVWLEIAGKKGMKFRLDTEEAIVTSATLSTFGVVPDYCPQKRGAANVALLAETARLLAGTTPNRSLFCVILGSHYAAQEGARYFYYPVSKANSKAEQSLAERVEKYKTELVRMNRLIAACDRTDQFEARDDDAIQLTLRIKVKLVGWVSNANADLRDNRVRKRDLEKMLEDTDDQETQDLPVERREIAAEIGQIGNNVARLKAQKAQWNDLRQQITDKQYRIGDSDNEAAFTAVIRAVRTDLEPRIGEIERLISYHASFSDIAERFDGKTVVSHFHFDFANDSDPWLFSMMGGWKFFSDRPLDSGSFLMHMSQLGRIYSDIRDPAWRSKLFTPALNPFYKPFSLCVPVQRSAPATVSSILGITGFQLMTVGDPLDSDELPVRAPVNLVELAPQMSAFFEAAANREAISLRQPLKKSKPNEALTYILNDAQQYEGLRCQNLARASSDAEGPARNAVLVIRSVEQASKLAGISRSVLTRINGDGFVFSPMLSKRATRTGAFAFGYDKTGRLNRSSMAPEAGSLITSSSVLNMFYNYGGGSFSYGFSGTQIGDLPTYSAKTLEAKSEGEHKNYTDVQLNIDGTSVQAYYADRPGPIKRIGGGRLLLGATAEEPMGLGVPLDGTLLNLDGVRQAANDLWFLNESRLSVLRERNIVSDALESLHAEAREHLDESDDALEILDYEKARAHNIAASCIESRVYSPLRGITNDLVKAVVVLLLLNIPFAFAMERLVFGFTSIYKQVIGFAGFFVGTFVVLYMTHPAFSLASAPVVIFLAFVIILLSTVTVRIVLGKIRLEIRAIQGLASTVHGVESDSNTALAAVLIGISGMRNRPLKTLLTATTVILLTFTILVFASFTSELGVVKAYLGKGQDEDRIELHRFSYLDINRHIVAGIKTLYGRDYHVFTRGGFFRNPTRAFDKGITPLSPDRVLYNPANGKIAGLGAVFGIDPRETEQNRKLALLAPGILDQDGQDPPMYLPAATAAKLEVTKGDEIRLAGKPFTYAGVFDAKALQDMTTIDETRIVPPDFQSTIKNMGKDIAESGAAGGSVSDLKQADIGSFTWFSSDGIAVTDISRLQDCFPAVTYMNFVVLYPRSGDIDTEKTAEELAQIFQGAVHTKTGAGRKKIFFTRAVAGSGFRDVIVPLLLGGLIIFSSLMGSIVDREKEIFTYSALGLSPPSVGALFFAESSVYSVVGGMGGYLVSQVVAKLLAVLGSYGIFHPPDMNFSSLSSVSTILIVMSVVMLSTIYPALKAGKSANPGVARKWKMPAPRGDHIDFVFPFTVSDVDFSGILSFMKEHFENHGDATLGNFAAREVELFQTDTGDATKKRLGIRANVSLAPFDLGIFQRFSMYSKEFEIKGIDEVVIELERLGGSPPAWVRGNRTFVNELRHQFLLWRSLPIETVEHYRAQTATELGHNASDTANNQ